MSGEPGYLRWTPAEWLKVAAHALPHLDKGVPANKALARAQRHALPKPRHRDEEALRKIAWDQTTRKYLEQARALPPEKRAEIAPPPPPRKQPPPRKKLDEGRAYNNGTIRWTTLEKARIARQVNAFKAAGDTRALSRLIIEAQELVIERDRRRPTISIQAGVSDGLNTRLMEEGTANEWLLTDAQAVEAVEAAEPTPATAAEQSATEPQATSQEPTPQALQREETLEPSLATADKPRALSEAARVFGEVVMGALDNLLAVHTEVLMREVYAKMSAAMSTQATETSQQIATQIAAMIERGMRETVHKIVEAELGGPVAPPTAGEAPAPEPVITQAPQPEPERPRQLKVDVVGLNNGTMEQEVRTAINGHADLRFFDPDARNGYSPHRGRHCIMVTQRVPHRLKDKIKAAGIEPIYVKSTPGHVIHAIEELHRSHSAGL